MGREGGLCATMDRLELDLDHQLVSPSSEASSVSTRRDKACGLDCGPHSPTARRMALG